MPKTSQELLGESLARFDCLLKGLKVAAFVPVRLVPFVASLKALSRQIQHPQTEISHCTAAKRSVETTFGDSGVQGMTLIERPSANALPRRVQSFDVIQQASAYGNRTRVTGVRGRRRDPAQRSSRSPLIPKVYLVVYLNY